MTCIDGYEGTFCEIDTNECAGVDCNNGTCIDGVNGFLCVCEDGYEGTFCEIDTNDCAGVDCNNGTCIDGIDEIDSCVTVRMVMKERFVK